MFISMNCLHRGRGEGMNHKTQIPTKLQKLLWAHFINSTVRSCDLLHLYVFYTSGKSLFLVCGKGEKTMM